MRWINDSYLPPVIGMRRIVKKFAWFPISMWSYGYKCTFWLENVRIEQMFIATNVDDTHASGWVTIGLAD